MIRHQHTRSRKNAVVLLHPTAIKHHVVTRIQSKTRRIAVIEDNRIVLSNKPPFPQNNADRHAGDSAGLFPDWPDDAA